MKNILLIFCLICIFYLSKVKGQTTNYQTYLSRFKLSDLPIILNENEFEKFDTVKTNLDSLETNLFFEKNRNLSENTFLYDVYKYSPLYEFNIGEFTAVVIKKAGGAGGTEDWYYLVIYDKNGFATANLLIAKQIGDCSFLQILKSTIGKDLIIVLEENKYVVNCYTGNKLLKENIKTRYKINNSNGSVSRLD